VRFLVTARITDSGGNAGRGLSASCAYPHKENHFWDDWGVLPQQTLRRFIGPRLSLKRWTATSERCDGSEDVVPSTWHSTEGRGGFPYEKHVEDLCTADAPCSPRRDYLSSIAGECMHTCDPCEGLPGKCPFGSPQFRCASRTCSTTYFSAKFRTAAMNHSLHLSRAYSVVAWPHWAELEHSNVSRHRVDGLEGRPTLWGKVDGAERIVAVLEAVGLRRQAVRCHGSQCTHLQAELSAH
jgi:hypothetical protein